MANLMLFSCQGNRLTTHSGRVRSTPRGKIGQLTLRPIPSPANLSADTAPARRVVAGPTAPVPRAVLIALRSLDSQAPARGLPAASCGRSLNPLCRRFVRGFVQSPIASTYTSRTQHTDADNRNRYKNCPQYHANYRAVIRGVDCNSDPPTKN